MSWGSEGVPENDQTFKKDKKRASEKSVAITDDGPSRK